MLPMFNKAVIAAAVVAATSGLALANGGGFVPAPASCCCHTSNLYVGAAVSRDTGRFEFNNQFFPGQTDISLEGVDGELFAGYGWLFRDRYYLGLEGFGNMTSNKGHIFGPFEVRQNWDAGVSLIPGVKVTDSTLLYARVGWAISEFKLKGAEDVLDFNHDTRNAVQAGLGIATMLTNNIGIRGEWVWSRYENLSVDVLSDGASLSTGERIHPITDQFKFGVFYNFNMA